MTLKDTDYLCVTCGHKETIRLKDDQVPRRRYWLACRSKSCKGKKNFFYPAVRPLMGRYR